MSKYLLTQIIFIKKGAGPLLQKKVAPFILGRPQKDWSAGELILLETYLATGDRIWSYSDDKAGLVCCPGLLHGPGYRRVR